MKDYDGTANQEIGSCCSCRDTRLPEFTCADMFPLAAGLARLTAAVGGWGGLGAAFGIVHAGDIT